MQRGFVVFIVIIAILWGSAVRAQTGSISRNQSEAEIGLFVGPIPPERAAQREAGDLSPAQQSATTAEAELLPLGLSRQGSFRSRLESGGRLEPDTSAVSAPSLRVGEGWWRTAGVLVLVIALILAVGAVVKRLAGRSGSLLHSMGAGGRAPSGLLYVLGRYPVGRGQMLILFKIDRRILVVSQSIGVKGGGMRTLCEITDPQEVAAIVLNAAEEEGRSISDRFRELVSGFDSSHSDTEPVAIPLEVPVTRTQQSVNSPDPLWCLHSRLDSLRAADWKGSA